VSSRKSGATKNCANRSSAPYNGDVVFSVRSSVVHSADEDLLLEGLVEAATSK
jgi:hypothetical protein